MICKNHQNNDFIYMKNNYNRYIQTEHCAQRHLMSICKTKAQTFLHFE